MTSYAQVEVAEAQLRAFLSGTDFAAYGGIVTDLDGTVVHEERGRIGLAKTVEIALKELYLLGRPVMINSLRFPLSVMRTFGQDWTRLANAPIPLVSLNGSQIGTVGRNPEGELGFEEIDAYPLREAEVGRILVGIKELLDAGIRELLVFYYPRDWRGGEVIWTAVPQDVQRIKERYPSASAVTAVEFESLEEELLREEICMVFVLIDRPAETLMAYQHSRPSSFATRDGVDKLFGSQRLAEALGVDLAHSVGAGDTIMDRFLEGVGLSLLVGPQALPFRGLVDTIHLEGPMDLGALLSRFVAIHREGGK
jgi:hydroxymethylpyrimidine pyrophosphatase-like HAD family hydrolase